MSEYFGVLKLAGSRAVGEVVRFHGLAPRTSLEELAAYLEDPRGLARAFKDLPEPCAQHLELAVFDPRHPREAWDYSHAAHKMQQELARRGLAFVHWSEERLPWRFDPRAAAQWFLHRHLELLDTAAPPASPDFDPVPGRPLERDVRLFLALVATHKPKLNKNGTLPRTFARVVERASWHAPAIEEAGDFFPLTPLILDIAQREAFLELRDGEIALTPRGWVFLDKPRPLGEDCALAALTRMSHFLVTRFVLALAEVLPPGAWLRVDALLELAASLHAPVSRHAILQGVFALAAVGRVERAGGSLWAPRQIRGAVRPSPASRVREAPVLQPTLEVLVPLEALETDFATLDLVGELVRRDRVSVYRFSRASIQRAIMGGMPPQRVLARIAAVHRQPLPAAVARQLEAWCQGFGQFRFRSGTLIECATAAQRDELVHWSKVKRAIAEPLGERWAFVYDDKVEAVRKALLERGTPPDVGVDRPGSPQVRDRLDTGRR